MARSRTELSTTSDRRALLVRCDCNECIRVHAMLNPYDHLLNVIWRIEGTDSDSGEFAHGPEKELASGQTGARAAGRAGGRAGRRSSARAVTHLNITFACTH